MCYVSVNFNRLIIQQYKRKINYFVEIFHSIRSHPIFQPSFHIIHFDIDKMYAFRTSKPLGRSVRVPYDFLTRHHHPANPHLSGAESIDERRVDSQREIYKN